MKYAVVINAINVFPQVVGFSDDADLMEECKRLIDCDHIEHVPADLLKSGYLMFADEYVQGKHLLINPLASYLYGVLEHGQPILGNAVILKQIPEDMDFMSKEEAESLVECYTPVANEAQTTVALKLMEDIYEQRSDSHQI